MTKSIAALAIFSSLLTSCAFTFDKAGPGGIVTSTTDALMVDNSVRSIRQGEACSRNILGLVVYGDASVEAAKVNSGIGKIAVANTDFFSILGIYASACTVVKGE